MWFFFSLHRIQRSGGSMMWRDTSLCTPSRIDAHIRKPLICSTPSADIGGRTPLSSWWLTRVTLRGVAWLASKVWSHVPWLYWSYEGTIPYVLTEGKGAAEGYDCKYTEVSAILNHKVDDLLVGTLKQIRLSLERETKQKKKGSLKRMPRQESRDSGCLPKSPNADSAIRRLIRSARRASKSCENLFSLWWVSSLSVIKDLGGSCLDVTQDRLKLGSTETCKTMVDCNQPTLLLNIIFLIISVFSWHVILCSWFSFESVIFTFLFQQRINHKSIGIYMH